MSSTTPAIVPAVDAPPPVARRRSRGLRLSGTDKLVLIVMLGIPTLLHIAFVWVPTLSSVGLSFTRWDGIGGLGQAEWIGLKNYQDLVQIYPPFWPAVRHNIIWLLVLVVASALGLFLAVLLDKEIRGTRIYQSVLFTPVVLSLVLVGFIWQLIYAPEQGLLNNILGRTEQGNLIDWLGNPDINLWAVLVAASWRHVGYIMILYLAGLKSVDNSLREAAAIDGASELQAFRRVIFPSLLPINVIVLVVTVIESLRAFDIVYVINKGTNGLELLGVLVVNNIVGEASRLGFGSAIGVILLLISLVSIITYLTKVFRSQLA